MRILKCLPFFFSCLYTISSFSQPLSYNSANAHSHNDYEQQQPFLQAYNEQFGSIEADVHLVNGKILVGHDSADLTSSRTLEKLYLAPLAASIKKNNGFIYKDKTRRLQLMIDVKTDSIKTLNALVALLKKYPSIINNRSLRIVITGNRPEDRFYKNYPSYIWFDGRADKTYSSQALSKIALLSSDLHKITKWNGEGAIPEAEKDKIERLIKNSHRQKKPIRFWASPDHPDGWDELIRLNVDYINTDHIAGLSEHLSFREDSLRLLPYNRLIHSAGEVIRFGNPTLENHALDVAVLPGDSIVVIEDRYGIVALDPFSKKILHRWSLSDDARYKRYMSTYSGIKTFSENGKTWIVWSIAETSGNAAVIIAEWNRGFTNFSHIPFAAAPPAKNALPNDVIVAQENGEYFIYVALNGNNELVKLRFSDKSIAWKSPTGVAPYGVATAGGKIYVTNWAGATATDSTLERAGVPWGLAYTDPRTGATSTGTVSVFDAASGEQLPNIVVGLHPNAIISSKDGRFLYVSNGSSDAISVINTATNAVSETIDVGILQSSAGLQGSSPNAMVLSADNKTLYVANGNDNAVAVIHLGKNASTSGADLSVVNGYIPTEAYPGGLEIIKDLLIVTNLESDGANVINADRRARSIHNQLASVSIIPVPGKVALKSYTTSVAKRSLSHRVTQLELSPRKNVQPVPVPVRLGEPSVFKHVVYIIKENKTYDQVYGDLPKGRGDTSFCVFGNNVTPNMHALATQFGWMDDYYASGKSSAEGHQWTDAGMVSDYVEKNVRAWFRSYPHRQEDALVYNKSGFIWNQALDNGKSVRIYGEACRSNYDHKLKWLDLYSNYKEGLQPVWHNTSTIARIRPILSPDFPDCDNLVFSDQQRADIFIKEWKQYEAGDSLPNLMIVSLPNDHTAGTSPDFPTPDAMVADNDLAVGRIVEMITKSKYWDSTVIFMTQDDSQSGWDHISAYRTVGLVLSPYATGKLVPGNYNQTSMLRTIEQILGIPPMNIMDATARLMTDCFQEKKLIGTYTALPSNIPLDKMNKPLQALSGRARGYALQSQKELFNEVDGGKDDAMNRIIWYYTKGDKKYPGTK